MGRIPGFRSAIFPADSIPNLTLVANIGLVLYLFLIGLETDVRFLVSNWRIASSVAFAGLALPFSLGCALAWGLYNEFRTDPGIVHIEFSTYLLFIGVAIAITVWIPHFCIFRIKYIESDCFFDAGLPRSLQNLDGIESVGHYGRYHYSLGRCCQRCHW